jgi:hypothetical protein
MNTRKQGYILVLVLIMIALSMMIATYLANKGMVFNAFTKTIIEREKAEQLALSGIQIALNMMYMPPEKKEVKEGEKPQSPEQQALAHAKKRLAMIASNSGKWQQFSLKKDVDGMDGTIKICVMAESGKININEQFDFEKGAFKSEKFMQEVFDQIKKQKGGDTLYQKVTSFLKKRGYPLNDVSELLAIEGFEGFKDSLWYDPDVKDEKKQPLYLYDLFTVYTPHSSLDPWTLSPSVASVVMQAKRSADAKATTEMINKLKTKNDWGAPADWDASLKLLYGKEYAQLSKNLIPLLGPAFDPTTFSVLCSGTFGRTIYKLYAIIERIKQGETISMQVRNVYYVS